jgi:hypothetical protein
MCCTGNDNSKLKRENSKRIIRVYEASFLNVEF